MVLRVITDTWTVNIAPSNKSKNTKMPSLRLECWNVRTMTTGWASDYQAISDLRKTAIINKELLRLQVDIAALQETRLAGSGWLKEDDYTFFWQGKNEEEVSEHGVGFAVKNTLLDKVQHTALSVFTHQHSWLLRMLRTASTIS